MVSNLHQNDLFRCLNGCTVNAGSKNTSLLQWETNRLTNPCGKTCTFYSSPHEADFETVRMIWHSWRCWIQLGAVLRCKGKMIGRFHGNINSTKFVTCCNCILRGCCVSPHAAGSQDVLEEVVLVYTSMICWRFESCAQGGHLFHHVQKYLEILFEQRRKPLVICCIQGIIPPSYLGIITSHYKDPFMSSSVR